MNEVDLAIYETAHDCTMGLPQLARLMRVNEQVLRNKVNPHCETHHLTVDELRRIMRLTGDTQALAALNAEFGLKVEARSETTVRTLLEAVLNTDAEHGDVGRAIREALADRIISPRERHLILKEILEAGEALDALMAVIREGAPHPCA